MKLKHHLTALLISMVTMICLYFISNNWFRISEFMIGWISCMAYYITKNSFKNKKQ